MSNPILSIVTGTYNRFRLLQQMVASVRANIPTGIPYEVIIVDGGSTDDTLAWCKAQPDVRLIEDGKLLGAISAFTRGAETAQGDYVVMANDDITFHPGSILRALIHLETHPLCGGVAFADNRPAPGYPTGYKVQTMSRFHDPTLATYTDLVYAQVGMFRRELGNQAGWWGANHPVMSKAVTYGGDNFLSAQLWEMGYTIDPVAGAVIDDLIPNDALRAHNANQEPQPSPFYEVYPRGVRMGQPPLTPLNFTPKLRILYLPVYEKQNAVQKANKRGLREALARKFLVYEIDWVNEKFDLLDVIKTFQPDILLTQVHGTSGILTHQVMARARASRPGMLIINWNGDVHEEALTSLEAYQWLQNVDVQLVVNQNVLQDYQARGIRAAYWQIGFEPAEIHDDGIVGLNFPEHDVVFLANCYSEERRALGDMLKALPYKVGLYGLGWKQPDGECVYDFSEGMRLYSSAKIAIGDNQYRGYGFVSNRVFEALGNGAVFLLHQHVDGLEQLTGLADGVHYVSWSDLPDLRAKIDYWLDPAHEDERVKIAQQGHNFVQTFHNFDRRVWELFNEILPRLYERVTA